MVRYVHELSDWPRFHYDAKALLDLTGQVSERRGLLIGRLETLGFQDLREAKVEAITAEALKSSEIEGEHLDYAEVRSSIARKLGFEEGGVPSGDQRIEGVVEMTVDATEHWQAPLTEERLFTWHAGLFPGGRGPLGKLKVGQWRDDAQGAMQVVSKAGSHRPVVHFQAPDAAKVPDEMGSFLRWFEAPSTVPNFLNAGIAHLWFVTIHPLEDGNGRIGRAILDLALARSDRRPWRCYSASAQIRAERSAYYDALECAQKGTLDITEWLQWYLGCLDRATEAASDRIEASLARGRFWRSHAETPLNERQRKVLNLLVAGEISGKLTNKLWKRIAGCSDATASRDLDDLVKIEILLRRGAGRSVEYTLNSP